VSDLERPTQPGAAPHGCCRVSSSAPCPLTMHTRVPHVRDGGVRCSAKGTLHILAPAEAQRLASLWHRASQRSPLKPRVVGCQPASACRTVDVLCISRRNLAAVKDTAQDTERNMRSLAASRHGASPTTAAPWCKHVRPHFPHMPAKPASKAIHPSKRMLDIRLHLAKTKIRLPGDGPHRHHGPAARCQLVSSI